MNIIIQAKGLEMTPAISEYVAKKIESLDKFVDGEAVSATVEVGKTTDHHRSGDIFRAEVNVHLGGRTLRAEAEKDDLYAAVDAMKDEMAEEIRRFKDKHETTFREGAGEIKRIVREAEEDAA
jgi:putative sigma-54 modulation protein